VSTEAGAIAADVGMDSAAKDFLQGVKEVGMSPDQLRAVLLTHWHNDHSAGAAYLRRNFGVRVYYDVGDTPFLTRETATHRRSWVAW
jgi:glyoxylase-like metal-dependent hydrolase (beta-lactamase superfamily II)